MTLWCLPGLLLIGAAAMAQPAAEPDADSKVLLEKTCATCHPMTLTTGRRGTRGDWENTITKMIAKGLDAPEDDLYRVLDILTKYYGPKQDDKLAINKAGAMEIARFFGLPTDDADRLIRQRQESGAFKSWDELAKAGVDPKKLEPKKDRIVY